LDRVTAQRFQSLPVTLECVPRGCRQLTDRLAVAGTWPAAGFELLSGRPEFLPEIQIRNRTSLNSILRLRVLCSMAAEAAAAFQCPSTEPRRQLT
jgi:hypothetical protein